MAARARRAYPDSPGFTSERDEDLHREALAQGHTIYTIHSEGLRFTFKESDGTTLVTNGPLSAILAIKHL